MARSSPATVLELHQAESSMLGSEAAALAHSTCESSFDLVAVLTGAGAASSLKFPAVKLLKPNFSEGAPEWDSCARC